MKVNINGLIMGPRWIAALIPVFMIACSNRTVPQAVDGFKGYKWGTDFSAMEKVFELKVVGKPGTTGNLEPYRSNVTSIGNAQLEECFFSFYKSRFYAVTIETKGFTNSRNLLAILKEAYGAGYQPNESIEEYFWLHLGDTSIAYDENSITGGATVHFLSRSITGEQEADEATEAKKGTRDL